MTYSIFGVLVKCAGVGVAKLSKNKQVRCGSVRSEKLLCTECAGVPKLGAHKYSDFLCKKCMLDIRISFLMVKKKLL